VGTKFKSEKDRDEYEDRLAYEEPLQPSVIASRKGNNNLARLRLEVILQTQDGTPEGDSDSDGNRAG
jgi:hypothetical protein